VSAGRHFVAAPQAAYDHVAMTHRVRAITYIVAGAMVIATGVGCGLLSAAKKVVANASIMADFSNKIQQGLNTTYQATYTDTDGSKVTVAQKPPDSVYVSGTGPWIFDVSTHTSYLCDNSGGSMVCQKSTIDSQDAAGTELASSSFATGGFMAGELGVALVLAAALVPSSKVTKSSKTIAGQPSECVNVTGLPGDGDQPSTDLVSFDMCITNSGVVSEFQGKSSDGKSTGSTMTKYSTNPDPSLFQPPPGAQIQDANSFPSDGPSSAPPDGGSGGGGGGEQPPNPSPSNS
jgi:hypothetical protein